MSKLLYFNEEDTIGIEIKEEMVTGIFNMCKESYPKETGGILIGKYSANQKCAIVSMVTGPPEDSKHGKTWFYRGTKRLQKLLDEVWETDRTFYLGEWHYHPGAAPTPSLHDVAEMKRISKNKGYNCPEPILIITGSNTKFEMDLGVYVFNGNDDEYVSLRRMWNYDN